MDLKRILLVVMAILYIAAGTYHFVKPSMYLKIMPPFLPAPLFLVYLSGLAEIFLGALLFFPATQVIAAWGLILLLIAVFPANWYMYQKGGSAFGMSDAVVFWRLPFQLVFILWAYWFTK